MPNSCNRIYDDFKIGDNCWFTRRFDAKAFSVFSELSGDQNALHHDKKYAASTSFVHPIVPLHLAALPLSSIVGMMFPGLRALYLNHEIHARRPIPYDVDIIYSARVVGKNDALRSLDLKVISYIGKEVMLDARLLVQVRDDDLAIEVDNGQTNFELRPANKPRVLVTGAAGTIGAAASIALAKSGWSLALHARDLQAVQEIELACLAHGADVTIHSADLKQERAVRNLAIEASKLGPITAVVHLASPAVDASLSQLMAVNYTALINLSNFLVPEMLKAQSGQILFIGSSALQYHPEGWDNYVAAKGAASEWTLDLSKKFSSWGIFGTVLAPGFVDTEFSASLRSADSPTLMPEQVGKSIVECLSNPSEFSGKYVWLETDLLRSGEYGFHSLMGSKAEEKYAVRSGGLDTGDRQHRAERVQINRGVRLPNLVREFFGLDQNADLSNAGIDRIPGWDSLRHIEFMLFLEERLGIRFDASDIERTSDLARLSDLLIDRGFELA